MRAHRPLPSSRVTIAAALVAAAAVATAATAATATPRAALATAATATPRAAVATAATATPRAAVASTRARILAFVRETSSSQPSVWFSSSFGGPAHRAGPGEAPVISPSGAGVAAATPGLSNTITVYATGTGHLTFNFTAGTTALPLAWSSDSRYLAVQLDSTAANGLAGAGLAVVDTTTDAVTNVATGQVWGASFAPGSSDRLVYGLSQTAAPLAPVNLYEVNPDGTGTAPITTNGRSLNPVWGAKGIVFDRERIRGKDSYPAYQLWLLHGSKLTRLTNLKISQLQSGLQPLAVSADGNRLIAAYTGEDTYYAWTVQIRPRRIRQVKIGGDKLPQPDGITTRGNRILVDYGAFMGPASRGHIVTLPFGGGAPHPLERGSQASWNG
jgi:hypothetical protein